MTWIESHLSLARHPKTLRLASELKVSNVTAIGHLHFLWWWAMEYAQDGQLDDFTIAEIARAAEWQKDPATFVGALERAGFIDPDGATGYVLHDWDDYAGKLIDRRRRNTERKRVARTSSGHPQDVARTSEATVPNLTVPNLTVNPPVVPPSGEAARKARTTTLDEEFIGEMVSQYGGYVGGEQGVRDALSLCCDHARKKGYTDLKAAARNWLSGDRRVLNGRSRAGSATDRQNGRAAGVDTQHDDLAEFRAFGS